jgi:hypothetical protein
MAAKWRFFASTFKDTTRCILPAELDQVYPIGYSDELQAPLPSTLECTFQQRAQPICRCPCRASDACRPGSESCGSIGQCPRSSKRRATKLARRDQVQQGDPRCAGVQSPVQAGG